MYWDGVGMFEVEDTFDGARSKNIVFQMSVPAWKRSYWELSDATYERERVGRWGGGGWGYGYGESVQEDNSDTDEGSMRQSYDEEVEEDQW
jgi:hypothetical protein